MLVAVAAAPRVLRQMGVAPDEIAWRAGIDPALFADPSARIPFSTLGRYVAEGAVATRCPHFGLIVGAEEGFANLGIVGRFVEHSPTVGAALKNLSVNFHHYELGATVTLSVQDEIAALDYTIEQPVPAAEHVADGGIAIAIGMLRHMCGPLWAPLEVQLMRARPRDSAPYRRILGDRVRFGAERNAIMFPARWLSHALEGAAPDLREFFGSRLAELHSDPATRFPARLRGLIRSRLLAGDCSGERVAHSLAMSRRTMHRRLAAEGLTFEGLLDEVRYDIARQMLLNSTAPMAEISASLNYANTSAFTRAFRRWSGRTPTGWRGRR